MNLINNINLKICEDSETLLNISKFVYGQYLREGLINKNKFSIWLTHFQLFEDTSIIYIESNTGKILSTASLVTNKKSILPAAINFPDEIENINQYNLSEIICLASISTIDALYRLFRFIILKSIIDGTDYLIAEVAPKRKNVFSLLGLKPIKYKNKHKYMDSDVILMFEKVEDIINKLPIKYISYIFNRSFPEDKILGL